MQSGPENQHRRNLILAFDFDSNVGQQSQAKGCRNSFFYGNFDVIFCSSAVVLSSVIGVDLF